MVYKAIFNQRCKIDCPLTTAKLGRQFLAVAVFVHYQGLLNADAIVGKQFFKSRIQRDKNGGLSQIHALLTGGTHFVKSIQHQGQTFTLHQKLINLIQLVI